MTRRTLKGTSCSVLVVNHFPFTQKDSQSHKLFCPCCHESLPLHAAGLMEPKAVMSLVSWIIEDSHSLRATGCSVLVVMNHFPFTQKDFQSHKLFCPCHKSFPLHTGLPEPQAVPSLLSWIISHSHRRTLKATSCSILVMNHFPFTQEDSKPQAVPSLSWIIFPSCRNTLKATSCSILVMNHFPFMQEDSQSHKLFHPCHESFLLHAGGLSKPQAVWVGWWASGHRHERRLHVSHRWNLPCWWLSAGAIELGAGAREINTAGGEGKWRGHWWWGGDGKSSRWFPGVCHHEPWRWLREERGERMCLGKASCLDTSVVKKCEKGTCNSCSVCAQLLLSVWC